MKAFLIDPEFHTIREIDYDGTMQQIYELTDCTCIDAILLNDVRDTVYVDDEGLYNSSFFWRWQDYPHPIAGKGLVLGTDSSGESVSVHTETTESLEESIEFISLQAAIAMGEEIDARNRRYMEANPDGPVIFCGSAADILKDKSYSGESD